MFGVGWFVLHVSINSGSVCPRASLRSDRVNHALDSVTFHMRHWNDHGVFHASGENGRLVRRFVEVVLRQVLWHCAVFSGWRAGCVRGAGEVSLTICFLATHDRCVSSPLLAGLQDQLGCAFLRHCTYRETARAFGPCTAPRTSHSPSSLRACHLRLRGDTGQCGVPQYALWLT